MARPTKQAAEAVEALGETLGEYLQAGTLAKAKRDSTNDALAFSAGLLFGALAAGVAAMFLAPTDGQTLRARLLEKFNSLMGRDGEPAVAPVPPAVPAADREPHVTVTAQEMADTPPAGSQPERTDAAMPSSTAA
ncbi:MAG: hypothetical protein ACRDI2_10435 [Chloroflexota bacterium]